MGSDGPARNFLHQNLSRHFAEKNSLWNFSDFEELPVKPMQILFLLTQDGLYIKIIFYIKVSKPPRRHRLSSSPLTFAGEISSHVHQWLHN